MTLLERLGVAIPIIQAPMAGTSTPALAAAVSNAGGLGSIGVAALDAAGAEAMIANLRALTLRAFNVNVFAHATPPEDPAADAAWLQALTPTFRALGGEPPERLAVIYKSFLADEDLFRRLLAAPPPVVSFHFGLPTQAQAAALKAAGSVLISTATSLAEAEAARAAGMEAVVAQGWEAGGHRGVFDPAAPDDRLGVMPLTRLLVLRSGLPVIAAGGIMDGRGVRAALDLGAAAVQLGTAFVACPESSADDGYRAALASPAAEHTVMTAAISGRPARCLANRFTALAAELAAPIAAYPRAYDAGKALNALAKSRGEAGFGAQWAGQGAPLSRALPAADLLRLLWSEAQP